METCERLSQFFQLYIDGTLDPAEVHIIEGHLDACPRCAREVESLRKIDEICRSIPVPLPSELERARSWEAIRRRLRLSEEPEEEKVHLTAWQAFLRWAGLRKPALAVSVAACAVVIASIIFFFVSRSNEIAARQSVILTYIEVASPDYVPILRRNTEANFPVLVLRRVTEEKDKRI